MRITTLLMALAWFSFCASASAEVVIETVPVGNPGNLGQLSGIGVPPWGDGYNRVVGAVDYYYRIGKFETTAGQYTEFLNAVAATDTYTLWRPWPPSQATYNRKILRSGEPGSYTYSVAPDRANRPVSMVAWRDVARFANWMHNGQPTGAQDLSTTEDGSYFLNGAYTHEELMTIERKPNATWVIPTEDEWYKAAYHKNDGVTGNYWIFPTGSDVLPDYQLIDPDPGNNATCKIENPDPEVETPLYTIGEPYWRTEVGEHENSVSPYGTFDQGGNLEEWLESSYDTYHSSNGKGQRGGSFDQWDFRMAAGYRDNANWPHTAGYQVGFRLALLPPHGDLNCDAVVNNADIPAFVLALTNPDEYLAEYPGCSALLGDVNGDGQFNDADIPAFVELLIGG